MEFTDGIDFESWLATVRSLSSAVDQLERTARVLAQPPWMDPLLNALTELNDHLRRLGTGAEGPDLLPDESLPVTALDPVRPVMPPIIDAELDEYAGMPDDEEEVVEPAHGAESPPETRVRVRFGDPGDIAHYCRPRRR